MVDHITYPQCGSYNFSTVAPIFKKYYYFNTCCGGGGLCGCFFIILMSSLYHFKQNGKYIYIYIYIFDFRYILK